MDEHPLVLGDGIAEVTIHPRLGASIGEFLAPHHILQNGGTGRSGVFALGSQVLAPFANRIAGGGFAWDGHFHPLMPNLAGERYPIHGNAFQSEWAITDASSTRATLSLASEGPGDFRYEAELTYQLDNGALTASIVLTNTGDLALPFGVGFHPWFVRTPKTRLRFQADGYWTETQDHLPSGFVPLTGTEGFAQGTIAPLPNDWINRAFTGWTGVAELIWPERRSGVRLEATGLGVLMLYSPSHEADFICLEPVSHSVDAHNRTGRGVAVPTVLAPGETLGAEMAITPFTP